MREYTVGRKEKEGREPIKENNIYLYLDSSAAAGDVTLLFFKGQLVEISMVELMPTLGKQIHLG